MSFDPTPATFTEDDLRLPVDMEIDAFQSQLDALIEEAEFLTNQAKAQVRQRVARLEGQEAALQARVTELEPYVSGEFGSPTVELEFTVVLQQLHAVQRDISDSVDAYAMMSVDEAAIPVMESWTPEGLIVVDGGPPLMEE